MFSIVTEARDPDPTRVSPRSRDPGNEVGSQVAGHCFTNTESILNIHKS